MHRKRIGLIFAAVAIAGTLAAAAPADTIPQGGGADNIVLSSTTVDGAFVARARTQVTQTGGISVASTNIADAATNSCTGCDASAVAVQAVIFTSSPRYFTPGNAAVATNSNCASCGAYAYAWQYLVQVDKPFTLTADAQQRIAELRSQIDATAASIKPDSLENDALLDERLGALTEQLKEAIDAAVVAAGARETAQPVEVLSIHKG